MIGKGTFHGRVSSRYRAPPAWTPDRSAAQSDRWVFFRYPVARPGRGRAACLGGIGDVAPRPLSPAFKEWHVA